MAKEGRKKVSRREFIKGAAVGAAGVAAAGALAGCAPAATPTTAPAATATAVGGPECPVPGVPETWDYEADVVIAGSGATGMPAAVEAAEQGVSVIVIDQNSDVGGCGLLNGGYVMLGGGTHLQKAQGIEDSPEIYFKDLTDYTSDFFRKNDRALVQALVDIAPYTIQWLEDHGVKFDRVGWLMPELFGKSFPRAHPALWEEDEGGTQRNPGTLAFYVPGQGGSAGAGVIRPLEAAAKEKGVQFLLEHKLTRIIRDEPLLQGRVVGIEAENKGKKVYIRAKKGVIIGTGGPKGNAYLRTVFDTRLGGDLAATGEPFVFHTGEGILQAQAIGAQLYSDWGIDLHYIRKRTMFGCKYVGLVSTGFPPGSPAFEKQRATGFFMADFQDFILVKNAGLRFSPDGNAELDIIKSMAMDVELVRAELADGGGPVWAVFDSDAAVREELDLEPPTVDPEYFFSADTIAELAEKIKVPADALKGTVEKYNSYVDSGEDTEFGKPTPKYKIQTSPFYAAWAAPILHDTIAGLRINEKCQVLDVNGQAIPGLYAGGEAVGGLNVHGTARAIPQGLIAAKNAAAETV